MHLTNDLKKQLKLTNSSIGLAKTIYGESPSNYAIHNPEKERSFRIEYGANTKEYSVILFDRTEKRKYEFCYLRGLFDSLLKISELLKDWIETEDEIKIIEKRYDELEVFQPDNYQHPIQEIEEEWRLIKNRMFSNLKFWKERDYEERYFKMLESAKRKKEWNEFYPFTSHDALRFSIDQELKNTWNLTLQIAPTRIIEKGLYYVGIPEMKKQKKYYFEELKDAIKFYASKLNEYQPTKWA